MKKELLNISRNYFLFLIGAFILLAHSPEIYGREVIDLNQGWRFLLSDPPSAQLPGLNDSKWESVSIPHDWAINGPFILDGDGNTGKLPWQGVAWYRRDLEINSQMSGKRIYLLFDGIMAFPEIFVNGKAAGKWDYGYNSFYMDVTDFVQAGKRNKLAIRVDTRKHESRWYPGAGIYRKVRMLVLDPVHVGIWGTYVTTPIIKNGYSEVRVATNVQNKSLQDRDRIQVETIILDPRGTKIAKKTAEVSVPSGKSRDSEVSFILASPERWDIDHPSLYKVKTLIHVNGKQVDEYYTDFGIRSIRFTADHGFFLNDRRVQLKGVNLHHDHGPLGGAFNTRAMERQLEIMKSMGVNAVRTSHNTAAPEMLELCDKMGLLFFNEVFDKFDAKGGMTDTTDFNDFARRNIYNYIVRDRNHPSVFLWSVGNEIVDVQNNKDNGFARLNTMVNYVRMYDMTRPVTLVCDIRESAKLRHFDFYDVHAWNYGRRYDLARQMEPNKSVIISESASTVSSRGFYELPLPAVKTDFTKSLQVSSYDLNAPAWAEISDDDFMWQEEEEYIAGEFVWTGFDYLGEPTPYRNSEVLKMGLEEKAAGRSSYFGIVDLVGIPKDRYYLYKSYWKPEETTVHVLPHWNWEGKEGTKIPVFVYTNGDSAELFLNGVSQGFQRKMPASTISTQRYRLMWNDVVYQPGEIKAVAYKHGKIIGEDYRKTAGKPYEVRLTPDRSTIKSDGYDLSYVLVEAFDKDGNPCPLADDMVKFKVNGPGFIAGTDNGNPQSYEPFKADYQSLFYGKAMLIIQAQKERGIVEVAAEAEGLSVGKTQISVE
jgi:beta-galactosidase